MNFNIKSLYKVIPLANILLAIGLLFFLSLPQAQDYWNELSMLNKQKEIQSSREEFISLLKSLDREKINRLQQVIPVQAQEPELLIQSEDLASSAGLGLSSINFLVKEDQGEVIMSQELSGSYSAFKRYLEKVESNLRLMDIENISLISDDKGVLKFKIDIQAYFRNYNNDNHCV